MLNSKKDEASLNNESEISLSVRNEIELDDFYLALISTGYYFAASDGSIDGEEVQEIQEAISSYDMTDEMQEKVAKAEAVRTINQLKEYLDKVSLNNIVLLNDVANNVIHADGNIDPREKDAHMLFIDYYQKRLSDSSIGRDIFDRKYKGIKFSNKVASVYYPNAKQTLSNCFSRGKYAYMDGDNAMFIEVPREQYEEVYSQFNERIRNRSIPNVTNFDLAKKIIIQGKYSYEEVKNTVIDGMIPALKYEIENKNIVSTSELGISTVLTYSISIWDGFSKEEALEKAAEASEDLCGELFGSLRAVDKFNREMRLNQAKGEGFSSLISSAGSAKNIMNKAVSMVSKVAIFNTVKTILTKIILFILPVNALKMFVKYIMNFVIDLFKFVRNHLSLMQLIKNVLVLAASLTVLIIGTKWVMNREPVILSIEYEIFGFITINQIILMIIPVMLATIAQVVTKQILSIFIKDDKKRLTYKTQTIYDEGTKKYAISDVTKKRIYEKAKGEGLLEYVTVKKTLKSEDNKHTKETELIRSRVKEIIENEINSRFIVSNCDVVNADLIEGYKKLRFSRAMKAISDIDARGKNKPRVFKNMEEKLDYYEAMCVLGIFIINSDGDVNSDELEILKQRLDRAYKELGLKKNFDDEMKILMAASITPGIIKKYLDKVSVRNLYSLSEYVSKLVESDGNISEFELLAMETWRDYYKTRKKANLIRIKF